MGQLLGQLEAQHWWESADCYL